MKSQRFNALAALIAGLAISGAAQAQETGHCGQPAGLNQGQYVISGPDAAAVNDVVAITRWEPAYIEIEIASPTGITIETQSGGDDPILILFDSAGEVIRADDDGTGSLNARVGAELDTGTYCAQIRTLAELPQSGGGDAPGFNTNIPFVLRTGMEAGAGGCYSLANLTTHDTPIGAGFEGLSLNGAAPGGHIITVTDQMPISVLARSSEIDTILTIEDSEGRQIGTDDDGGGGTNSYLGYDAGLVPGEYCLSVSSFDSQSGGGYSLSIQDYDPNFSGSTGGLSMISDPCGDSTLTRRLGTLGAGFDAQNVTGRLDGEYQFFSFELSEPMSLRLTTESEEFDTVLALFDADGELINENDDAEGLGTNSRLNLSPELAAGSYCAALSPYDGPGGGAGYHFNMIELSEAALLAEAYRMGEALPSEDSGVTIADLGVLERNLRPSLTDVDGTAWFLFDVTEESLVLIDVGNAPDVTELALFDYEGSGLRIAESWVDEDTLNRKLMHQVGSGLYALAVVRNGLNADGVAAAVSIQRYIRPPRAR